MSRFAEGFLKSWGVILASEIGDKTFFIAAIMAMRNSRTQVFIGALGALAAMTVLSALMGWAAPNLISKTWTHYGATGLFLAFGLRMLYDAAAGGGAGEAELAEVEKELAAGSSAAPNGKSGGEKDPKARREGGAGGLLARILSPVLLEAFALTFMAEWGDRSQIATIGLAAASDVWGVAAGGVLGHALCTGAAVLGGKHLATHIDERMVAAAGGLLFLVFGAHAAWIGVPE